MLHASIPWRRFNLCWLVASVRSFHLFFLSFLHKECSANLWLNFTHFMFCLKRTFRYFVTFLKLYTCRSEDVRESGGTLLRVSGSLPPRSEALKTTEVNNFFYCFRGPLVPPFLYIFSSFPKNRSNSIGFHCSSIGSRWFLVYRIFKWYFDSCFL